MLQLHWRIVLRAKKKSIDQYLKIIPLMLGTWTYTMKYDVCKYLARLLELVTDSRRSDGIRCNDLLLLTLAEGWERFLHKQSRVVRAEFEHPTLLSIVAGQCRDDCDLLLRASGRGVGKQREAVENGIEY